MGGASSKAWQSCLGNSLGLLAAGSVGIGIALLLRFRRQSYLKDFTHDSRVSSRCSSAQHAHAEVENERRRRTPEDLLTEVKSRSKGVMYMVSNKTNDEFSLANPTSYLRKKGVDPIQCDSAEETIVANAEQLIQILDKVGNAVPPTSTPLRHEIIRGVIAKDALSAVYPAMKEAYIQQPLDYGRNSRYGDKWRISCYLVVMDNWKPKIEPHEPMVKCMSPIMDSCIEAFSKWYCTLRRLASVDVAVMNAFVTRYRPVHEEDQLKRHIDGANVDGSVILALPTDDPFEGGELHVWDGKPQQEFLYRMNSGDVIFLDNAVWHQAKPITSGTRWALVLFLRLKAGAAAPP